MYMIKHIARHNDAFSLIELLVVIAIIATIIGLALPNFLGARSRARDARRKGEMQQLKTALQLYYNDYKIYPADSGGPMYNKIIGCGTSGVLACPCQLSPEIDFASGGGGCETVYMTKLPGDFGTSMWYYRVNSGADFCIKVSLENASDSDIDTSHLHCQSKCTGSAALGNTDYAVCSE